ncbi:neuropeptide Y receptor type 1-like isoform X2 [Bradysia coprophila]|uniref:neuropeptide Y receptor type 1-like isoform X2 n=1 Tax=Bradysia coprophila TaxID=38358 RepID=UPI00187D816E|nr:neuropeptide Y receptor type 1-like isoform X2 [Bradysia coprophila]
MTSSYGNELNEIMKDLAITYNASNSSNTNMMAEDLYEVPVGLIILMSVCYGTISLLAVIGNSLVIWIIATTKSMQTVTNFFISNLALADVVIGVFCIPFQFQAALLQRWNLPEFMCSFCPFIQMISLNVSIFTLTAIAIDRHRAIMNPLRAKPTKYVSKLIISGIWFVSIIFSIPIAVALRVTVVLEERTFNDGRIVQYQKPFCDNTVLDPWLMRHYRYFLVFFQYMIPVCLITFIYVRMAIRLGSKTPGNAQNSRDVSLMRNKKRVIKMLIIVVLLFGICWCPLQVYHILQVTWECVNEYKYINIVWFCSDWLAMSNSCYNPFIYGIYNDKFKRELKRRFPIFRPKDNASDMSEPTTMTMYSNVSTIRNCNSYSTRLKEPNGSDFDQKKNRNYTAMHRPTDTKSDERNVLYQPICIELSTNNFSCCCHSMGSGSCSGKSEAAFSS